MVVKKSKTPKRVKVKKTAIAARPKPTKKELELIKKTAEELLALMGMEKAKASLVEKDKSFRLEIDYDDPGILIGNHGETISSIQLILSLMIYKKLGAWHRVIVNVGDYLEKRTESLESLALNTAQRVKFSGKETVMSYLNSAERRIVHLTLADNPDVSTESIGEGRDRRLVIKPKA